MLTNEAASARLKEFEVKDSEKEQLKRIANLPASLRSIPFAILARDANGKPFVSPGTWDPKKYELQQKAYAEALVQLDSLTGAERTQIFSAFLPKLGSAIEAVWNPDSSLYQTGPYRKAFRVTGRPDLTRDSRSQLLGNALRYLSSYTDMDLPTLAAYMPYIGYGYVGQSFAPLFAAAIDSGSPEGEEVFDILLASGKGEHAIGTMGQHVVSSLLQASRPEGWDFIEKLLLAAQRQEGLRQSILEAIDEANRVIFRRLIRVIVEHDLIRFSSVVRAADVWFGFGYDALTPKQISDAIYTALNFLEDPAVREETIATSENGERVYLALWALATEDVLVAVDRASALLQDTLLDRRAAAIYFLIHTGQARTSETKALLPALDDPDIRIPALAYPSLNFWDNRMAETDLFERLERLLPRLSKDPKEPEPLLFPWIKPILSSVAVANALPGLLGDRDRNRLLAYIPQMDSTGRYYVVSKYIEEKVEKTPEVRDVLINFLTDASESVRGQALEGLKKFPKDDPVIVEKYESLLSRKSGQVRKSLIGLLLEQQDSGVLESAERLISARQENQRVAGLDLLAQMVKGKRMASAARESAARFTEKRPNPSEAEKALLETLLEQGTEEVTLNDALGLMDPTQLSPVIPPTETQPAPLLVSVAPRAIRQGLDDFIHERREMTIRVRQYGGDEVDMLLAEAGWGFPNVDTSLPLEEDLKRLPLREELEQWWNARPASMRDPDGRELLRTQVTSGVTGAWSWTYARTAEMNAVIDTLHSDLYGMKLRHEYLVNNLMSWLERMTPPIEGTNDFLLDAAETSLARAAKMEQQLEAEGRLKDADELNRTEREVLDMEGLLAIDDEDGDDEEEGDENEDTVSALTRILGSDDSEDEGEDADKGNETKVSHDSVRGIWRNIMAFTAWLERAKMEIKINSDTWTPEQVTRLWKLLCWKGGYHPKVVRERAELDLTVEAFRVGAATEADLYDQLLGPRPGSGMGSYYAMSFSELAQLSGRKDHPLFSRAPELKEMVANCRRRVLEVELNRGDTPTLATAPAQQLAYSGGVDVLIRIVQALGKESFMRGYTGGDTRSAVFSRLARVSFPGPDDTPEAFAEKVAATQIPEKRLVEVALYAPHWARHVEAALGWPQFAEGVWWFHAHTKDDQWNIGSDLRESWTAEISDKTPLTAEDLLMGAVDVKWFHRVYSALGMDRWKLLDDAAKFASSSGGHKRAQLFADAMLGKTKRDDLLIRIKEKRNQDSLRALGLIPLPNDLEERSDDTLLRYTAIQEFLRTSKQFGPQRQESEKAASRIGMENLARTAGYPDPIRLEWAMEQRAVADLAQGPVAITAGDVTVSLSINPLGEPDILVLKNGKALKAIPPATKKDPAVSALVDRRKEIERQVSRMRLSLENAMVRGDVFTGWELGELFRHPVLQPMLRSLVFVGEDDPIYFGYPRFPGMQLEDYEMATRPVTSETRLRIAHPYDLLQTGHWDRWQRDCFLHERVQPFKQVFRELYVLTPQEQEDKTLSRRYTGHQVNPNQATALFTRRGWVSMYEADEVRKTFHEAGISAWVEFMGWTGTAADVEGKTVETIRFTRRTDGTVLPLESIPPRLFSEVMRDLDLVVSVAHVGGVDPEASASTVEMRASLVREAASLLQLENLRYQKSHVLIDGHLGTYSVHLGSAIVHRQPGGYVCIVPVHSQHRGRLFLPFADDDPRTAEVISKVLLLAKDKEIKDPTILEQLVGAR